MKRLFSLSVCLITMLSFAYSFEVDGIYYNTTPLLSPYTVEVTYKSGTKYTGEVTIPATVYNKNDKKTYNVTRIGKYAFRDCSDLTSVIIPNSVTYIGSDAFSGCSGLTSITIPNSVTIIGDGAFIGCSGLTFVTIPNSVTKILDYTFYGCSGLISITIPNSVTKINEKAFFGCTSLTSITIPNSVTSIGEWAFYKCSGLTSVTIPNSVTSIGTYVFYGCTSLTSITIPNSVMSIGDWAFADCTSLTSITIPNSVTSIGYWAFYRCTSLTSITIPNSVMSIGEYAFANCSSMKEIVSYIEEPFATNSSCWSNVPTDIPLYVPAGTKEKYQNTDGWKGFTNIIEFGGDAIEPTEETKEVDMSAIPNQIDLNGMVVGDTYYVLNAENGDGADSESGCVVIKSVTSNEAVSNIVGNDISDEIVKKEFKGIIFMIPAGTGRISISAETAGSKVLMVKVGSQAAQSFSLAEREIVKMFCTVSEPTYVYIYAGDSETTAARGSSITETEDVSVKVYSYKWEPTELTGIRAIDNGQWTIDDEAGAWYTLDGRKLISKPAQKGVYIKNGKKVVVK